MSSSIRFAVAVSAVGILAVSTHAAVVVDDGFEYASQAAFDAVWTPITTSPTLDSSRFATGAKSVTVPGSATVATARARLTFGDIAAPSTSTTVTWSFDFYDSLSTAPPARNYANLQDTTAPAGTNQLISMGLNNNQSTTNSGGNYYMARILGYTPLATDVDGGPGETGTLGAGAYFKLNDYGVGLRTTGFHNLKVIVNTDDGLSTDYAFYVDNVLAETVNNVGTAASSFRQFDNIALGSGLTDAGTEAGFDNMFLSTVTTPEPTTLAAMGLVGASLFARRRRA